MMERWDDIEANWEQMKKKVRQRWSRLTEDELDLIDGRREQLIGALQEEYGIGEREAEHEVEAFCGGC